MVKPIRTLQRVKGHGEITFHAVDLNYYHIIIKICHLELNANRQRLDISATQVSKV